jgi:NitT/TauT family transport system permease protein/sulfonate transport system permease protein
MAEDASGRLRRRVGAFITAACSVVFLVMVWQSLRSFNIVSPDVLPSPAAVADRLLTLVDDDQILNDALASVRRVLLGVSIGVLIGASLGVVACIRGVGGIVRRAVELIRPIPPIAWIPLAIAWQGVGYRASVVVVVMGVVFHFALVVTDAIDHSVQLVAPTVGMYELRQRHVLWLALPAALPEIMTGLRLAVGLGWTSVIAAELVGGDEGLGYLIQQSRLLLDMEQVLVCMMLIGAIGVGLSGAASLLERGATSRFRPDLVAARSGRT